MSTHRRNIFMYTALAIVLAAGLGVLAIVGPRWLVTDAPAADAEDGAGSDARKIHARLFYVSADGFRLSGVDSEVLFGEGTVEQAKRIIEAQLTQPSSPLASPIPVGTKLRTIFLTQGGEAYVDLSREVQSNHPGGTTNELLTVYALVAALTANLPAVTGVQILVDGKEVDTLAGHLDLRRPIGHDPRWIAQ